MLKHFYLFHSFIIQFAVSGCHFGIFKLFLFQASVVEWLACVPRVEKIVCSRPRHSKPKTMKLVFLAS